MATRGTPGLRLVGNPLGGILRDLGRRSRSTTRPAGRRRPEPAAGDSPPPAQTAPPPPPAPAPRLAAPAAVLTTDEHGRATWTFPTPFGAPPVLTALPAGPCPLVAVVEEVTAYAATLRVWRLAGRSAPEPACGVTVHCTARPRAT